MSVCLISLGANLPGPRGTSPLETCRQAVGALAGLPALRLTTTSRWFATRPVPASDQPPYVNGVVRLEGEVDPVWLLGRLHAIEHDHGRCRGVTNAARTLDLDLLAMDGLVRDADAPLLPHPRLHQRGFVMVPLCDVAAEWFHPVLLMPARAILAALPIEDVVEVRT